MKKKGCPFCDKLLMTTKVRFNDQDIACRRFIFENDTCYAVLKPEQHTHGEALIILSEHVRDITDNIDPELLSKFIVSTHKLAQAMKCCLINDRNEKPDKIYTCTLCDGIEHLHFHLIPRYPFTNSDRKTFEDTFSKRDKPSAIRYALDINELGGFWYVAYREANHKKSEYWNLSDDKKANCLESLASCMRKKIC